jgi:hypothetical protein
LIKNKQKKVSRAFTFRIKKDNYEFLSEGLSSLRRWPDIEVQGMNELIEFLKLCYDEIDAEDKKVCFLYSALYLEDCEIYIYSTTKKNWNETVQKNGLLIRVMDGWGQTV